MKKIFAVTFVTLALLLFALASYAPVQGSTQSPDFVIQCYQNTLMAEPGTSVEFRLSLVPVNGFRGTADFTCAAGGPGVACQAPLASVRLASDLVVPFAVKAGVVDPRATPGTYLIGVSVQGHYQARIGSGNVSHNNKLYLTVVPRSIRP
jgi:hypothetical protein